MTSCLNVRRNEIKGLFMLIFNSQVGQLLEQFGKMNMRQVIICCHLKAKTKAWPLHGQWHLVMPSCSTMICNALHVDFETSLNDAFFRFDCG